MRILIVGASHGIGLEATRQALEAGHDVRAFARSAPTMPLTHERLEKCRGDALDEGDVGNALDGVNAVLQTLGIAATQMFRPVTLFSAATRVLIAAMQARDVRRLVAVTGFGAGASKASISVLQRWPYELVFGRAYADKSVQERLIEASGLDWTIVRPGVLTGGPRTRRYRVLDEPSAWRNGIISRADVADFLVKQLEDRRYVRKAPVLIRHGL
jgi:putative NADH-flavin reductase